MVTAQASRSREVAAELKKHFRGDVRADDFSRALYSTDASIYQMQPVCVAFPRDSEDVRAAVEAARRLGVPILPRGAATSLSGQTVNHAIVLDFTRHMRGLLDVSPEGWARVQPGVVVDQLNEQAAPLGWKFAPDPTTANRATIGGVIGNNSCGSHSVIYGKTIDHVRALDVVLADGTTAHLAPMSAEGLQARLTATSLEGHIYREVRRIAVENRDEVRARFPKVMRRVSGYNLDDFLDIDQPSANVNLARMVVGSEGTLCVVTQATVRLVATPKQAGVALLHFQDMAEACDATNVILPHGPSAVEMIGRMIFDRCRESPAHARLLDIVDGSPEAVLAVEFYAESRQELQGRLESFKDDMARRGTGYACRILLEKADQDKVWALRSAGLGLLMSTRGDSKPLPYVEDTAVDPERLGEYVRRFDQIVREHGTTAGYYGHASVGCLHIRPLVNLKTSEGVGKMASIAAAVSDLVLEFGGSLSGEHGDGIVRGAWNEKMFGPKLYGAFREIKRAFDPGNIMNPGKIIDTPPMTENLRTGPGYRTLSPETRQDFSKDFGFAGAVEMCNGMGTCLKDHGVMCPSYTATRDEEHSTRGRANLLRSVLSGDLPAKELTGERLHQALDLCVECKGCKVECETGVDMAKLKAEFLDGYNRVHKPSLRTRAFARIGALSRLASMQPQLANRIGSSAVGRAILGLAGVEHRRPLPKLASKSLSDHFYPTPRSVGRLGSVALFADTFTSYYHPEVGMAAVEILERAGFRVYLVESACCGRPMISKGFLDEATANAHENVDWLSAYLAEGIPIVGLEPSCVSAIRDEYPSLLRSDRASAVAKRTYLLDEFLMDLRRRGNLDLRFNDTAKQVLFHGHCHQKALTGTKDALDLLRLAPGYKVEEVQAGCCGMAGSFGFEKEHYDVSLAMGEHSLFPAVRAKGSDWEVAITGVSCRQQIEHATGRRVRHLAEVLRDAVV